MYLFMNDELIGLFIYIFIPMGNLVPSCLIGEEDVYEC